MTESDKQLTTDEIIETKKLQLHSLFSFMQALNYEWAPDDRYNFFGCPNHFESHTYSNKGRSTISFQSAVALHNGNFRECHGKYMEKPFDFDPYLMTKAIAAKVLKSVKLQLNKKTGFITCQNNLVEFVNLDYYKMFINSLKYFPF